MVGNQFVSVAARLPGLVTAKGRVATGNDGARGYEEFDNAGGELHGKPLTADGFAT
jgi:hypothetical protein